MNDHARGFDNGYSAAIHDARVPGSRAYAELHRAPAWTFVWWTDDGPSLGPLCADESAATDAAYADWMAEEGGTLRGYDKGTRGEFDAMLAESPDLWIVPLQERREA